MKNPYMNNPYDNRAPMRASAKLLVNDIIKQARLYLAENPNAYNEQETIVFKSTIKPSYKVSCKLMAHRIQDLITRLEKGQKQKLGTFQERKTSALVSSPKKAILAEFLADGEIDNAVEYALLNDLTHLLPNQHKPAFEA